MSEPSPRPIGTEFETVIETPTERIVTVWRVVGHVPYGHIDGSTAELIQRIDQTRQPKAPPTPQETKEAASSTETVIDQSVSRPRDAMAESIAAQIEGGVYPRSQYDG